MLVYTRFENQPLLFNNPRHIISCYNPSEIKETFEKMESALDSGQYLAGFLSYEAGYGFEKRLESEGSGVFPLVYMGCYPVPLPASNFLNLEERSFVVSELKPSINFQDYSRDINRIRDHISIGEVYQITYCMKMKFSVEGDTLSMFRRLLLEQPVPYPAYIDAENFKILSLSPEMFLKKKGHIIDTKPMKGTWPRGTNLVSDIAARFRLKYDKKNRAENLMITDLLRNDLGRVGDRVRVKKLFEVSSYATLYQMTSSIAADVKKDMKLYDLFKAVFPSGSVTGAPKIRSMEIIRDLEREERKIYTGAIGYISPERNMFFNVPIRTILVDNGRGEMGVGGGIIWDSTPHGEWAESMLKSKFLAESSC